jgi:hypothetical protein
MTLFLVNIFKNKISVGHRRAISSTIRKSLRKWIFSIVKNKPGFHLVTREELAKNSQKYHVFPFSSEEKIVVNEPYNGASELPALIKNTSLLAKAIGTFSLQKPFVSEVENAELVGPVAVGFDREGNPIAETVMQPLTDLERFLPNGIPPQTLILKNLPSLGSPCIDTACSLVNWSTENYSHWLLDLTRLEGLEYYQKQTGIKPALIIEANSPKWKRESLRLLGYEPEDCIPWNGSRIKVKRLIVPTFRREQHYSISPTACRWLRERMSSNLPEEGSKQHSFSPRIYISRSKTTGRQVINEDAVMEALKPFGFVAYIPEEMSFTDEVKLFSQAEIIVAPHGSGLANMIFAQNASAIELFGSSGVPCFLVLAQVLGFQYGCLTSEQNHNWKNHRLNKYDGIMVDIPKLQALVADMLSIKRDRQPVTTTS